MTLSCKWSALTFAVLVPWAAQAQLSLVVNIGPPPLPVYEQPVIPGEGYIWTPGYWAWSPVDIDYYWVPGTWALAPAVGLLWTPGYWAFEGRGYRWRTGYWGHSVGFYGGINYGYGYTGHGYWGGRWNGRVFQYNQSVNHIDRTVVRNVYNTRVVVREPNLPRISFNGRGGVEVRPTVVEQRAQLARHVTATPPQLAHERAALSTSTQRMSVNHGMPQVAATPRPSAFSEGGAVRAREPGKPAAPDRANEPPRLKSPQPGMPDRALPRPHPVESPASPRHPVAEPIQGHVPQPANEPQVQAPRPVPARPAIERPQVDRPQGERPQVERPQRQIPERPQVQRPEKAGPGAADEGRGGQGGHKERQRD